MSASGTLASQFVEFTIKGLERVQAGMDVIRAGLTRVEQATQQVAEKVAATPAAIGAAVAGFQMLTSAAKGWVQAGLAGTAHGNLMQLQFQLLSREIAGVFVPTINKVTDAIQALAGWFRGLSGDQQRIIEHFVQAAAVMLVVNQVLGRVKGMVIGFVATLIGGMVAAAGSILTTLIPAISTLVSAINAGAVTVTTVMGVASAGITVVIGIVAGLVGALVSLGLAGATAGAGLAVGTAGGRAALAQLWQSLRPLVDAIKAFGSSLMSTLGPALDQLGTLAAGMLGRLATGLGGLLTQALPVIQAIVEWTVQAVGWLMRAADTVVTWVASWVSVRGVVATVVGVIGAIAAAMAPLIVVIVAVAANFAALGAVIAVNFALIGAIIGAIAYVVGRVVAAFMPFLEAVWNVAKAAWEIATVIGGAIIDAISSVLDMGDGLSGIGEIFEAWIESLSEIATWLGEKFVEAAKVAINMWATFIGVLARVADVMDRVLGTNMASRLRAVAAELRRVSASIGEASGGGSSSGGAGGGGAGSPRTSVQQTGGQLEGADATWKRIVSATAQTAVARDEERNQLLGQIATNTTPRNRPRPRPGAVSPTAGSDAASGYSGSGGNWGAPNGGFSGSGGSWEPSGGDW